MRRLFGGLSLLYLSFACGNGDPVSDDPQFGAFREKVSEGSPGTHESYDPALEEYMIAEPRVYAQLGVQSQLEPNVERPSWWDPGVLIGPTCPDDPLPIELTFRSEPSSSSETAADFAPWTQSEENAIRTVLGIALDLQGRTFRDVCIPGGAYDLIQRWVGPADPTIGEGPTAKFKINIRKRLEAGGGASWNPTFQNITLNFDDATELFSNDNVPLLVHELTHAITTRSFPNYTIVVTEGVAVAMEVAVSQDLGARSRMENFMAYCDGMNAPGIGMRNGLAFNDVLQVRRYAMGGCFFLRLQHASATPLQPLGTFITGLRTLTRTHPPRTSSERQAAALDLQAAISSAAPSSVEGLPTNDWLAGQHIFTMDQPLPSLAAFVGPLVDTEGNWEPRPLATFYKRYEDSGGSARELGPTWDNGVPDTSLLFDAVAEGGWYDRDYQGFPRTTLLPFDVYSLTFLPPVLYWGVDINQPDATFPACPWDSGSSNTCKRSREAFVQLEYYTHDVSHVVEARAQFYVNMGPEKKHIGGVTRNFNVGTFRITLTRQGLSYNDQVAGGTFDSGDSVLAYPAFGSGLPPGSTFTLTWEDLAAYRGPVRVERMSGKLVLEGHTYTKLGPTLHAVF